MESRGFIWRFLIWFVYFSLLYAANTVTSSVAALAEPAAPKLNDTGVTEFFDGGFKDLPSEPSTHPRQDASYGRDALARAGKLTKTGGGHAGFDFTKIANNGTKLLPNATLGTGDTDWACTRDNVTGLMWEVKTTSGLRSKDHTYSWYNSNSNTNGGNSGTPSGGKCHTNSRCDTEKFVDDVNRAGLCGTKSWRMPTIKELLTIANYGRANPAVDPKYFPNIPDQESIWSGKFWSGTTMGARHKGGKSVYTILLSRTGDVLTESKEATLSTVGSSLTTLGVLLVHGGIQDYSCSNPDSEFKDNGDGTVTHLRTSLTWQRCVDGQKWEGGACKQIYEKIPYYPAEWSQALKWAAESQFAGYNDWRLPNVKELYELMTECFDSEKPSVNLKFFAEWPYFGLWSSSNVASNNNDMAWHVQLMSGIATGWSKASKQWAVSFVRDVLPSDPVKSCVYTLNPSVAEVESKANNSTLGVTTSLTTCPWTATSNADWLTVTSGASGNGGGEVAYSVTANTGTIARTGKITVAGQDFTVTQKAPGSGPVDPPVASPTPTPTPSPTPTPTPTPISTQPPNRGLTPTPTPTPRRPQQTIKTSPHQIKATGGLDRFYP